LEESNVHHAFPSSCLSNVQTSSPDHRGRKKERKKERKKKVAIEETEHLTYPVTPVTCVITISFRIEIVHHRSGAVPTQPGLL
jgi:hypothetical protein